MKTFNKIALVSAIAAAPFAAQADLTPMDDSLMGNTTGQAGVTIEINIAGNGISVGEIEYVDTEGQVDDGSGTLVSDGDGGSVKLQNLVISNVDGLKQTIDVKESGDLVIGMNALSGVKIGLGAGADKSAVLLQGSLATQQAEVVNNLDLTLNLGKSTTTIVNMSAVGANATELLAAGEELTQAAFDTGTALVGGVAATQADLDNSAVVSAGVGSLANTLGGIGVIGGYENTTSALAIKMKSTFEITDMNVGLFGYTQDQADAKFGAGATADAFADGAAINITGLKFYGKNAAGDYAEGSAVEMDQTIWAQGGPSLAGGGVYVQIGQIAGTLDIGGIELGGTSIGQVKISDINLAGMTQRIYGH